MLTVNDEDLLEDSEDHVETARQSAVKQTRNENQNKLPEINLKTLRQSLDSSIASPEDNFGLPAKYKKETSANI